MPMSSIDRILIHSTDIKDVPVDIEIALPCHRLSIGLGLEELPLYTPCFHLVVIDGHLLRAQ